MAGSLIRSISTKVNGICLWRRRQVLPGFGLTLGFALLYLCLLVLLPLSAAFLKASGLGWDGFIRAVTSPRVVASFGVSVRASTAVTVTMLVLSFLLLLIINLLQRWSVRWLAR